MLYSIKDERLNPLIQIISSATEEIEQIYHEFADRIMELGKESNSELMYVICKSTITMMDEDYIEAMQHFSEKYDELSVSFMSVSRRYRVGEIALGKVQKFQEEILERVLEHQPKEMLYVCDGNAELSHELIQEYKECSFRFLNRIESAFENYSGEIRELQNSNMFGDGIEILVRFQYETIQKICMMYRDTFDKLLDWFERTLHAGTAIAEEEKQQARIMSEEAVKGNLQTVILKAMDNSILMNTGGGGSTNSVSSGSALASGKNTSVSQSSFSSTGEMLENKATRDATNVRQELSKEQKQENIIKDAKKTQDNIVNSFYQDLDSPQKIQECKGFVTGCQKKYDEYKEEKNPEEKKAKFKKCCEFIKEGAKKYAKPLAKALGMVVPMFVSEGHVARKFVEKLPEVIECFSGKENKETDEDKLELGLECMKSVEIDKWPENKEELKEFVAKNGVKIGKDILKKVLTSDKFMNVLGIDEEELSKPENQKLYKEITGKEVTVVPQKRNAYAYDFEQYDPQKIKDISPTESKEKVKEITRGISEKMPEIRYMDDSNKVEQGIRYIRSQVDSGAGYIRMDQNNEMQKLIEELRNIVNGQVKEEVLPEIDGRYNKQDMIMLCDELEYENKLAQGKQQKPNVKRACQNFVRRQLGYPTEYEKPTVKVVQELIPLLNEGCQLFVVENEELIKWINGAQIFIHSKNSEIKRKKIKNSMVDFTTGLGTFLGIGAAISMATLSPLGIAGVVIFFANCLIDDHARYYTSLVYNLGEDRTDMLLRQYKNVESNCFQRVE